MKKTIGIVIVLVTLFVINLSTSYAKNDLTKFKQDSARLVSDVKLSGLPPEERSERIESFLQKYGNPVVVYTSSQEDLEERAYDAINRVSRKLSYPTKAEFMKDAKELKAIVNNQAIPSEIQDAKVLAFQSKYHVARTVSASEWVGNVLVIKNVPAKILANDCIQTVKNWY
jgi:hypothetical protein